MLDLNIYIALLAVCYATFEMAPIGAQLLTPKFYIAQTSLLPTYILLPDDKVGHKVYVAVAVTASNRRTRWVELFYLGVESFYKVEGLLSALVQQRKYAPHHNRWVVYVLRNQLLRLL